MTPRFAKIKNLLLGKRYDLSVAFLSSAEMRKVAKKTADADKASNVLAFPLSKNSGEILLCRGAARPFTVEYLFIHACLHLKGLKHGARMEGEERRILRKFGLRTHVSNRHRN